MVFDPDQQLQLAHEHSRGLRHDATRAGCRGRLRRNSGDPAELSIMIRPDRAGDSRALARLAGLDSAAVPPAPLLLAEVGGELRAALSLANGAAIADPFHRTAWLVTLLNTRAAQLRVAPRTDRGLLARARHFSLRVRRSSLPAR